MSLTDGMKEKLLGLVTGYTEFDKSKINPDTKFIADMGLDSLDIVDLIMSIEDEFSVTISDEEAEGIVTVQDAYDIIATQLQNKSDK